MTLRLQSCFVNQNSSVCIETGESETDMCVDEGDLGGGDAGVLEFHSGALFAAQYDDVSAFHADGAGPTLDGFEGIFNLEDVAIGREDCDVCELGAR